MAHHRTNLSLKILTMLLGIAIGALPTTTYAQSKEKSPGKSENKSKPTEIEWHAYEDGVALAEKADKQILIDFKTGWCGYCKKMDRETFSDKRVIDYINDNFVAIKVDGDSRREIEIDGFITTEKRITKEVYGVTGYPTFWFLESDGTKIGRQPGYQPPKGFMSLLEYVSERKYTGNSEDDKD